MSSHQYDIVILGGGPAGLATAIATATKINASILLVEQHGPQHPRVGENIPPETLILLKKLGVERQFHQSGHELCPSFASVWGRDDVGYNDFIVNPLGQSWRLNRLAFDAMLTERAQQLGVNMRWNTRFEQVSAKSDGYNIQLSDGQCIEARFVIDATGSAARFAKSLGIKKHADDKLVATVRFANVKGIAKGKQVLIEAMPTSWCYHTLLPQQKVVSMVVAEQNESAALKKDGYRFFEQHLATTRFISKRLQQLDLVNCQYHTYPITSGVLPQMEGDNWLAVGDAAASFDPIAAQGIYKGLQHGLMAADKVSVWYQQQDSSLDYSQIVTNQYQQYLTNRAHMYRLEQRFVDKAFWQHRVAGR